MFTKQSSLGKLGIIRLSGGTTWSNIFTWNEERTDDDDTWHLESYDLASYLTSTDFKVRAVAKMSSSSEEVMIDDLTITGTPKGTGVSVLHSDGFGGNLNAYTLSGDDDWEIDDPHVDIPGSDSANDVLTSNNCDDECIITVDASLDTTSPLTIAFDRFVDAGVPYYSIPRSPYFGDVEISEDGITLVITAPPLDLATAIANNNTNNPAQQQQ